MTSKGTRHLTDAFCRKAHHPGRYTDGRGNLVFVVSPTGTRRWLFRYQRNGRRREIGLGPYPLVTLAKARELALDMRRALQRGEDPKSVLRTPPSGPTFREAALKYIEAKDKEWRNAKHRQQWRNTLEAYAFPYIGEVPVAAVTVQHVLAALKPIWTSKPETAVRLRGRIETVLDFARAQGWREGDNPARWRGHLDHLLPRPSKINQVRHHPALDWRKAPDFVAELREMRGIAARALEFLILTAVRSGEVRGARWEEFDLVAGTWTIPAHRTKSGREHRVPLGRRALELLRRLPRLDDAPVFPGENGEMSDNTLLAVIERMNERRRKRGLPAWTDPEGRPVTVHGFRATFRTCAHEKLEFPREVAEAALGHVVGDRAERSYVRGDALEKRRALMEAWEKFLLPNPPHPRPHVGDRAVRSSEEGSIRGAAAPAACPLPEAGTATGRDAGSGGAGRLRVREDGGVVASSG